MRILVVDESKTMRSIIRNTLGQGGAGADEAEIAESASGGDALGQIISFKPHLIIAEGALPDMDGLDLVRALRSSNGRSVRLMIVSDNAARPRIIEAIRAGVDDYLVKPFTPEILIEHVKEVMARAA